MRDMALNPFWVNRFALTVYDKDHVKWRDVTRTGEDMFLPIVVPWLDRDAKVEAVARGYAGLPPTWNAASEDRTLDDDDPDHLLHTDEDIVDVTDDVPSWRRGNAGPWCCPTSTPGTCRPYD